MKTLPQIVSDMRANAQFLMELAKDIEQAANFFGGAVTQPDALPASISSIPAAPVAPTPPKKEENEAVRAAMKALRLEAAKYAESVVLHDLRQS